MSSWIAHSHSKWMYFVIHRKSSKVYTTGADPGGFKGFHGTPIFERALILLDELLEFILELLGKELP